MRRLLRTMVETLAVRSGLVAVARRTRTDRVAVLAYHNVVPVTEAGRGDASLHLPLDRFVRQVEQLARTHDIVDLRDLDTGGVQERRDRPRAIITFDDAYRGAVTRALPELTRRGIPAVVFVSPALLGDESTWWDELGEAGRLTERIRETALNQLRGLAPAVRRAFLDGTGPPPRLPASYGIATREELLEHLDDGISIGSHAWAHEHLPGLAPDELERSLTRSLEWVRALDAPTCSWLALPYGAGSPDLGDTALALGYDGVLRISGGLWRPPRSQSEPSDGRSFVPRINIPAGLTPGGLALRTSGLR